MRDQFLLRPFGRLSIRNFLLFFATMIVAAFTYLFAAAPTANAATDLTWKDGNIVYQSNTYLRKDDIKAGSSTGLPEGTKVFTYFNPPVAKPGDAQQAQMIYFPANIDPTTAQTANFVTYDYAPPDKFSNPTAKTTVSATPQSAAQDDEESSSCNVEGGLGWMICPLTRTLSTGMDNIFNFLTQFLEVQPISTDQESSMFRAWSIMRNFANVAFVIAFLVVIYSQISNVGLSNYGLKRLLPRLIIAAILVNVSYWICAIGVDLSNIIGHSIQGVLNGIRDNLVGAEGTQWNLNWTDFSSALLTGTAGAGLLVAGHSFVAAGGGGVIMLLPILLGVIIAALIALIVLAARQAIITIMIILAPLAFVAFLLPNTEKYFKKWHELFITMLIVFPAFALVFSGAQLAGDIIIQNAIGGGSLILLLLGMTVKIAPVAITPLLMKVSGSLLGKVAGIANNPGKGLLDRTRNMAKERADARTSRTLAGTTPGFMGIGAAARRIDANKRKREGWKKANEGRADAAWAGSEEFSKIHHYDAKSHQLKEIGENAAARHTAIMQAANASDQNLDYRARASKVKLDLAQATVDTNWDEVKAGNYENSITVRDEGLAGAALTSFIRNRAGGDMQDAFIHSNVEGRRAASAQSVQKDNLTSAYLTSADLQNRAGGIAGKPGADAALADAIKGKRSSHDEAVGDARQLLNHFNPDGGDRQKLAMGGSITVTRDGVTRVLDNSNVYAQEAAIEMQLSGMGNYDDIETIIMNSGGSLKDFRTTISAEIPKNKLADKAFFFGGKTINSVAQAKISNERELLKAVATSIAGGKIKPENLATMEPGALKRIVEAASETGVQLGLSGEDLTNFNTYVHELRTNATTALTGTSTKGRVTDKARVELNNLEALVPPPAP